MKKVFGPLAEMDFANLIAESYADTQTGSAFLAKYKMHLLTNESSCTLVNSFIKEAQAYQYDGGVCAVVKEIVNTINENKVSWQLATACEAINSNKSSYNYLNRNAASTVETLLEQSEENVVKYIKAGALKHVMFCEAFRNIVNGVFVDCQTIVTEDYTAVHPVSYIEENEGKRYFEVLGNIFSVEENEIKEAKSSDVSGNFLVISRLLESGYANFDANSETLTVDTDLAVYEVCAEDGAVKCTRKSKKCKKENCEESAADVLTFTNEHALREHNRLVVGATHFSKRNAVAEQLESIARAFENFENFALLDNVQIIENKNDKFVVIENEENALAYSLKSNHSSNWKVNTTIVEALDFIKKQTNLNISKDYKENINKQIELTEAEKAEQIAEDIKKGELLARKQKIEMLTEKFKNSPAELAILSKIAQSLNE